MRLIAFPSRRVMWGASWAGLLDVVLAAAAVVLWANAHAPRQDLPWKPLRLADPPGLATGWQLDRAASDPTLCRATLHEAGVRFVESPPQQGGGCSQLDAVRLTGGTTPLSPARPVMTCRQALAYALWDRQTLRPAAREVLGEPLARVDHMGTYACRNMYGRAGGPRSQHAFANALDVGGFTTASGRRVRVLNQFGGQDDRGVFLRRVRDGGCKAFHMVLSPDYNAAHRDHLHLDSGSYRRCD